MGIPRSRPLARQDSRHSDGGWRRARDPPRVWGLAGKGTTAHHHQTPIRVTANTDLQTCLNCHPKHFHSKATSCERACVHAGTYTHAHTYTPRNFLDMHPPPAKPPPTWMPSTVLTRGGSQELGPAPQAPRKDAPIGKDPGEHAGSPTRTSPSCHHPGGGVFSFIPRPGAQTQPQRHSAKGWDRQHLGAGIVGDSGHRRQGAPEKQVPCTIWFPPHAHRWGQHFIIPTQAGAHSSCRRPQSCEVAGLRLKPSSGQPLGLWSES